jgi:hypothetical protein
MPCARDMRNLTTGTDSARMGPGCEPYSASSIIAMVKGWSWTAVAEARASGSPWLFVRCRMGDRRLDVLYVFGRHGRALAGLCASPLGDLTCVSQCVRARRRRLARERRPTAHVVYWCGEPYDR